MARDAALTAALNIVAEINQLPRQVDNVDLSFYNRNMETKQEILNYLVNKYEAKGIILYGSRALGLDAELSDWDIYVFTDKPESEINDYCEYREFNGQQLDVNTHTLDEVRNPEFYLKTAMHPVGQLEVLYDDLGGQIHQLAERSIAKFKLGPEKGTLRQHELRLKILRKFLTKAKARSEKPEIVFYSVLQFFNYAVRFWFEEHQQWPLPIHSAMAVIKSEDKIYAEQLELLYTNTNTETKVAAMERIYEMMTCNK